MYNWRRLQLPTPDVDVVTYNKKKRTSPDAKKCSFQSTGIPKCYRQITPLLEFFITNGISLTDTDITPSHDMTAYHSPLMTVITKQLDPRLHNSKTNRYTYR